MLFWVTVIFWTWPAAEEWSKGLQKKKKKKKFQIMASNQLE